MSFQEYAQSTRSRLRLGDVNLKLAAGIVAIGVVVVIAIVAAAVALLLPDEGAEGAGSFAIGAADDEQAASADGSAADAAAAEVAEAQAASICVHVSGCVANPGICYLNEGARVADAIEAVGGMTADAAAGSLNLARVVADGEQIDVMSMQEAAAAVEAGAAAQAAVSQGSASLGGGSTPGNGKVNINTATSQELQTLSGIGESKAGKIIAYREANGAFSSVDELTNVSGIGDKTLESIRDAICI